MSRGGGWRGGEKSSATSGYVELYRRSLEVADAGASGVGTPAAAGVRSGRVVENETPGRTSIRRTRGPDPR